MRTAWVMVAGGVLCGALLLSCSSNKSGSRDYLSYDEADHLLFNMERAWANRDIVEYRDRILSDGKAIDGKGRLCSAFTYYLESENEDAAPEPLYGYDEEIKVATSMFGGKRGPESPEIEKLELIVERLDEWSLLAVGSDLFGDPCPAGTRTCTIGGLLRVHTAAEIEGEEGPVQSAHHHGRVYVFPARPPGATQGPATHFRLWKWVDLGANES